MLGFREHFYFCLEKDLIGKADVPIMKRRSRIQPPSDCDPWCYIREGIRMVLCGTLKILRFKIYSVFINRQESLFFKVHKSESKIYLKEMDKS